MHTYTDGIDFHELRAYQERPSRMWRIEFDGLDAEPGTVFAVTSKALGWSERRFFCWEVEGRRFGLEVAG